MMLLALLTAAAMSDGAPWTAPDEKFGDRGNRGGNGDPTTIDAGIGETYTCWEGALSSAAIHLSRDGRSLELRPPIEATPQRSTRVRHAPCQSAVPGRVQEMGC